MARCPYCGWDFAETPRHRSEGVLPYCSHGCRLAVKADDFDTRGGNGAVSYEHAPEAKEHLYVDPAPAEDAAADPHYSHACAMFAHAMHALLCLPAMERNVVCLRYQGRQYRDIASDYRLTIQAVEQAHRRAIAQWPALRVLFRAKWMHRRTRKEHAA